MTTTGTTTTTPTPPSPPPASPPPSGGSWFSMETFVGLAVLLLFGGVAVAILIGLLEGLGISLPIWLWQPIGVVAGVGMLILGDYLARKRDLKLAGGALIVSGLLAAVGVAGWLLYEHWLKEVYQDVPNWGWVILITVGFIVFGEFLMRVAKLPLVGFLFMIIGLAVGLIGGIEFSPPVAEWRPWMQEALTLAKKHPEYGFGYLAGIFLGVYYFVGLLGEKHWLMRVPTAIAATAITLPLLVWLTWQVLPEEFKIELKATGQSVATAAANLTAGSSLTKRTEAPVDWNTQQLRTEKVEHPTRHREIAVNGTWRTIYVPTGKACLYFHEDDVIFRQEKNYYWVARSRSGKLQSATASTRVWGQSFTTNDGKVYHCRRDS